MRSEKFIRDMVAAINIGLTDPGFSPYWKRDARQWKMTLEWVLNDKEEK